MSSTARTMRCSLSGLAFICVAAGICQAEDFQQYIRTSVDFQRVGQSPALLSSSRWDRWVLLPWRYQWGRPYDLALARRLKEAGHNGAVCDYMPTEAGINEQAGLCWYLDHAAGKGDLFLRPEHASREARQAGRRPVCLADSTVRARLLDRLEASVGTAKEYPSCIAYALDDEVSWSSFTNPCCWDNSPESIADFHRWLLDRYGSRDSVMDRWGADGDRFWSRMATPDDFQDLYKKPWPEWNLSPWADAISYMDSQLGNLIGQLVAQANSLDPDTPAGIVGGQCPSPYGGYDYAKLMRKVQFLEAYDLGCATEMARSLSPSNALPLVSTCFGDPFSPENIWLRWHHLIHGQRGMIAWAEGWFREDGVSEEQIVALGEEIQRLAAASSHILGGRWRHDGVALYYSHPSIQVSWFIDCQPHGRTWINRSSSMNDVLASTVGTFWAWTKLLEDAGVQYNFYSYADLLEHGIDPEEHPVLILPRALALSDQEAQELGRYVQAGGHLIADHCPGWFDQHLRGREHPVLDDLFGIREHTVAGPGQLFGGRLLAEIDAERHADKNFAEAAAMTWDSCLRHKGYVVAERGLPCFIENRSGTGWAHLMNVSVIEYVLLRVFDPPEAEKYRQPVEALLRRAGVEPWIGLQIGDQRPQRTEAICWQKGDRVVLCVARNPLLLGVPPELWQESIVVGETVPLKISFDGPVQDAIDERTGKILGDGDEFVVPWTTCEAAVVSFEE